MMCWCTPEIRTPFCGSPNCHPPASTNVDVTDRLEFIRRGKGMYASETARIAQNEIITLRKKLSEIQSIVKEPNDG